VLGSNGMHARMYEIHGWDHMHAWYDINEWDGMHACHDVHVHLGMWGISTTACGGSNLRGYACMV
jgi:hypothetical protein